jgi:hypothetical protein
MKTRILYLTLILPLMLLGSSCTTSSVKADEPEIATMDSVSTNLEQSQKELDEQAKKVEASLEQIEKES